MNKIYQTDCSYSRFNTGSMIKTLAFSALLATSAVLPVQASTDVKLKKGNEYMLVSNYPNNLHVLDLKNESILKSCQLPDAFGPGVIRVSPNRERAYILNNHYETVYGIELDSCKVVFKAHQSTEKERVKTIFSLALSPDGKELYTIQNPTQMNTDHYVIKEPRLAVFNTDDGINAKPVRTFKAPRQVTVMSTTDDGSLMLLGEDIYSVDVKSGKTKVALANRNWDRKLYAPPDVLNAWPIDSSTNEFLSLYTTARFQDETMNIETADWIYGFHTVDLKTGKAESIDFGPIEEIYFTGVRSPKDKNFIYGVLNRLAKYDISKKQLVKAAEIDHSYYCIAINDSATKVYLAGTFNDVAIYDAETLEKTGSIVLPGGDMGTTTAQVFRR